MAINKLKVISSTKNHLLRALDDLSGIVIIDSQSLILNSSQYRNSKDAIINLSLLRNCNNPIIYIVELVDKNRKRELFKNFEEFTSSNITKTKNKDRVNVSKYNKTGSEILYVGSSTTDFKSRIKNHLGVRGNRVYSLHLSKWDKNLNYNINIKSYELVSQKAVKIDTYIVELIEQQIWDELQPSFGKRSGLL